MAFNSVQVCYRVRLFCPALTLKEVRGHLLLCLLQKQHQNDNVISSQSTEIFVRQKIHRLSWSLHECCIRHIRCVCVWERKRERHTHTSCVAYLSLTWHKTIPISAFRFIHRLISVNPVLITANTLIYEWQLHWQ